MRKKKTVVFSLVDNLSTMRYNIAIILINSRMQSSVHNHIRYKHSIGTSQQHICHNFQVSTRNQITTQRNGCDLERIRAA